MKPLFSLLIGCFRAEPNKSSTLILIDLPYFFVHKYGGVFFFRFKAKRFDLNVLKKGK